VRPAQRFVGPVISDCHIGFAVPDMDTISLIGVGFAATRRVWNVRKFSAVPSIVDILGQRLGVEMQQAGLHSIVFIPRTSCSTAFRADHGIYEVRFLPRKRKFNTAGGTSEKCQKRTSSRAGIGRVTMPPQHLYVSRLA
jgi:hypothetical protein